MSPVPQSKGKHFLEVLLQSFEPRSESDYLRYLFYQLPDMLVAHNCRVLGACIWYNGKLIDEHDMKSAPSLLPISKDGYAWDDSTKILQLDLDGIQMQFLLEAEDVKMALSHLRTSRAFLVYSWELAQKRSRKGRANLWWFSASVLALVLVFALVPIRESLRLEAVSVPVQVSVQASAVASPVLKLNFANGDTVKAGQVMIELDPREIREQMTAKRQELMTVREQISLLARDALTKEEKLAEKRVSEAQLRWHEQELALLEFQASRLVLTAPQDGVIHFDPSRLAVGRTVSAGEELCELRSQAGVLELYVPVGDIDVWERRQRLSWVAHDAPDTLIELSGVKARYPDAVVHRDSYVYEYRAPLEMAPGKTGLVQVQGPNVTLLVYTVRYIRKHLRW